MPRTARDVTRTLESSEQAGMSVASMAWCSETLKREGVICIENALDSVEVQGAHDECASCWARLSQQLAPIEAMYHSKFYGLVPRFKEVCPRGPGRVDIRATVRASFANNCVIRAVMDSALGPDCVQFDTNCNS